MPGIYKPNIHEDGRFLPANRLNKTEEAIYDMSLEVDIYVQENAPLAAREMDIWINPNDKTGNLISKLPSFIPSDRGKYLTINNKGEICWAFYQEYNKGDE